MITLKDKLSFIGEVLSEKDESEETVRMADQLKKQLSECVEKGEDGKLKMIITLPDESVLDSFAKSLARMANAGS